MGDADDGDWWRAYEPSAGVLEELEAILEEDRGRRSGMRASPGVPEVQSVEPSVDAAPCDLVRIPVPEAAGSLWASRLPGLRLGTLEQEVQALAELGIDRVVCLAPLPAIEGRHGMPRFSEVMRARFGARFHCVGILDHHVPPDDAVFERVVEDVLAQVRRGERVMLHCVGGCGRTGTFAACVLVRAGLSPGEAILHFRRVRRCGPETPHQIAYVVRYARRRAASA